MTEGSGALSGVQGVTNIMGRGNIWLAACVLGLAAVGLHRPAEAFTIDPVGCATCSGLGLDATYALDGDGVTAHFTFVATWTTNAWNGELMDSFSLQFGGGSGGLLDQSLTAAAAGPGPGTWTRVYDKVSGNGCTASGFDAVCFTMLPSGLGAAGGGSDGAPFINRGATDLVYTWTFDVRFSSAANRTSGLAGDNSIKFLSLKYNRNNNRWSTGHQLSESGTYTPGDDDEDVPEPGTLALFGLGMLGLGWAGRRRRAAA